MIVPCSAGWATEAGWIWSPKHTKNEVPEGACYFRKTFTAQAPIRVQATIAADDEYELFVNGQKVGAGESYRQLDEYNITEHIKAGRNTIAVKVTNRRGPTAALVARVFVREREWRLGHLLERRDVAHQSQSVTVLERHALQRSRLGTGPDLWNTRGNRTLGPRGRCGQ